MKVDGGTERRADTREGGLLRQQFERVAMSRTYGSKMTAVEGDDGGSIEALRQRDHRGIGSSEREIPIPLDKLCHTPEVFVAGSLDVELGKTLQKRALRPWTEACAYEIGRLSHGQSRHNQAQISP